MKKTVLYTGHGLALVRLLDGKRAVIQLIKLEGATKEDFIKEVNKDLHELNAGINGVRFLMICGAVLDVTKTTTLTIDGDDTEYTNEKYEFESVGEMTAEEQDDLERILLGVQSI